MNKIHINFDIEQYNSISELSADRQKLIEAAQLSIKNSYAPYSNFNVGAAVLLANGEIITGSNQENSAYPSGLCAERVALFFANHKYPKVPVLSLVVCAYTNGNFIEEPTPPCGSCRQVMLETETRFNQPIELILFGSKKILIISKSSFLLPLSFTIDNLKN